MGELFVRAMTKRPFIKKGVGTGILLGWFSVVVLVVAMKTVIGPLISNLEGFDESMSRGFREITVGMPKAEVEKADGFGWRPFRDVSFGTERGLRV